jgi:hypothetical protein
VLDDTYALARRHFPDATIIVASQASRSWTLEREGFGPIIMTGAHISPGLLSSDSTQRVGLVTNVDLTATILSLMNIEAPVQVLGSQFWLGESDAISATVRRSLASAPDSPAARAVRLNLLTKMNNTAISVEAMRPIVMNTTIWLTVAVILSGAFVITFADRYWRPLTVRLLKALLYLLILGVLSAPVASWLMFLIYRWPGSPTQVILQFLSVEAGLWVASLLLWYLWPRRAQSGAQGSIRLPLLFLSVVTAVTIIGDQLLGAPASFTSFFGYSPIAAFRFYGIGNEAAAILVGAVIVGIALFLDQWPESAVARHLRLWGVPFVGLVVIFVCAAPRLGANVGVAAWATFAFGILWLLVNRWRINLVKILAIAAAAVLILATLVILDRYSAGAQTHLARSIGSAERGGFIELWQIIVRKAGTNLRVFAHSSLTYVFAAVIIYLVYMRWRPTGDFAHFLREHPFFGDAIWATLIGGIVAFFTEDSGIVLPALMVLYMGAALVWLMLSPLTGKREAE